MKIKKKKLRCEYSGFIPPTENVICTPNRDVDGFLNNLIFLITLSQFFLKLHVIEYMLLYNHTHHYFR